MKTVLRAVRKVLWPFPTKDKFGPIYWFFMLLWIMPMSFLFDHVLGVILRGNQIDWYSTSQLLLFALIAIAFGATVAYYEPIIRDGSGMQKISHRPGSPEIKEKDHIFHDANIEAAVDDLLMSNRQRINTVEARAVMEVIFRYQRFLRSGITKGNICEWLCLKGNILENVSSPNSILKARISSKYDNEYYPKWEEQIKMIVENEA